MQISMAELDGDDGTENSEQKRDQIDYLSLLRAVLTSDTVTVRAIFDKDPGAATAQLAQTTVLHGALAGGLSIQFAKDIVDLTPQDSLERRDAFGRTALHMAAMGGNTEAARILVEKSPRLMHQEDANFELPLHLAACHAHRETVLYLLSVVAEGDPEGVISGHRGAMLLEFLIIADFYDIALEVVKRSPVSLSDSPKEKAKLASGYPRSLFLAQPLKLLTKRPKAFARRRQRPRFRLSALRHLLCNSEHYMKKPSQYGFLQKPTHRAVFEYPHAIDLLKLLIGEVLKIGQKSATQELGDMLCIAAQVGNYEAVVEILQAHPILLWFRNGDGHGFLQVAVLNGQERVFDLLHQLGSLKHHLLLAPCSEGSNILHLAARGKPSSDSSAALQVQRGLHWFKEVERNVPPNFRDQINNGGETPKEVFAEQHEKLLEEGDKWMKKTAESCTVVAALVVTVVFAAAFTVPGGNNDSNGIPNYLTDASFMTFAISDTLGLVSSTTSLLMFLSILSSRFSAGDLLNSRQYMRLSIGLVTLFFSLASMLVTFTASLQIVLGHRVKWIAVPIGILASLPVILFARLQFPLLVAMVCWTLRPIFSGRKKVLLDVLTNLLGKKQ